MMDKIVVLAAGRGTRMRQEDASADLDTRQTKAAESGIKALIPIDRPFLDYVLTAVADAGYRRVCLVTAPAHDELRDYYTNQSGHRLRIEFATQEVPLGTAHALLCAREFAAADPFALINSDNYYPPSALASLRQLDGCGLAAFSVDALIHGGNISASRVASFATVESDDGRFLTKITEKPAAAQAVSLRGEDLISMNCWRFGPAIFEACQRIERSPRGEYEVVSAVSYSMAQLGQQYQIVRCCEAVLDLSCREDVAAVTEKLTGIEVRL
jgi:glucose-1-phosphate thymidylyltransferase